MERKWMTLDQIKAEYASNDYNPELLLQHLLHHVEASPASAPGGWKHSCNALCLDGVELWIPQCPHCGKPAPTPPVSEDRKDAERYLWLRASDFDIFGSPHAIHLSGKELDQAIDAAMEGK